MSINALHSASTALNALSTSLDVTANNLANVNTDGFKSSRANFADLLYDEKKQPGVENTIGDTPSRSSPRRLSAQTSIIVRRLRTFIDGGCMPRVS